jgi:hypothetical protein
MSWNCIAEGRGQEVEGLILIIFKYYIITGRTYARSNQKPDSFLRKRQVDKIRCSLTRKWY